MKRGDLAKIVQRSALLSPDSLVGCWCGNSSPNEYDYHKAVFIIPGPCIIVEYGNTFSKIIVGEQIVWIESVSLKIA